MVTIPRAKYHTMQGAHQNREAITMFTPFFFTMLPKEMSLLFSKPIKSLKGFIELFLHAFFSLILKTQMAVFCDF